MLKKSKTDKRRAFFESAKGLVKRYFTHRVARCAAELAYYLLFSLFPMLIFVNAAAGVFKVPVSNLLQDLQGVLPEEVMKITRQYFEYLSAESASVSTALFLGGITLTLFSLSRSVRALMAAVSRAYRQKKPRKGAFFISFAVTAVLLISVCGLIVLLFIGEKAIYQLGSYVSLPARLVQIWDYLRFLAMPLSVFFILAAFYKLCAGKGVRFVYAMPGAACALSLWLFVSTFFSKIISMATKFSLLYGSLSTVMVLMIWLYFTGVILIMGAELNDVLFSKKGQAL